MFTRLVTPFQNSYHIAILLNDNFRGMYTGAVYHLLQVSGNSVWNVNGTRRFRSSRLKIFEKREIVEKVVLFFPYGDSKRKFSKIRVLFAQLPIPDH